MKESNDLEIEDGSVAVLEKPEINRTFVEEIIESKGTDRAITRLRRCRAGEIKEMIFNEYPELDMDEEAVMDLTKKELLNWLNHFYTDNIKETCYG